MKTNDIDWSKVPDILAKEQVRLFCHCSKRAALYYLKSGKLPCIYSGKKTRCYKIRKEDLMAFICEYLKCDFGDIMEALPDDADKERES